MLKVLGVVLVLSSLSCGRPPPLVILASVDGPAAWHPGYLIGDAACWKMVPHAVGAVDLLAGVHEGFHRGWAYGPPGGLRGQGSLLTLAKREGWTTAVFAASSEAAQPALEHLSACAQTARLYPAGIEHWPALLRDLAVWGASNRAPRFATVHLSLQGVAPGNESASALTSFWGRIDAMIRAALPASALVAVYVPEATSHGVSGWLRILGDVPGAALSRRAALSTLDVAPTVATVLDLLYTPDYPGQSLAALMKGKRVEPVSMTLQGSRQVLGDRWIARVEGFQDSTIPSNVRFFDLWSGRFSAGGSRDPAAIALLDRLPDHTEPVAQDSQDSVTQPHAALQ